MFKKLFYLLLLAPTLIFAQVQDAPLELKTEPAKTFYGVRGADKPLKFQNNKDLFIDTVANKGYFYNGKEWREDVITPRVYGGSGSVGPQGPKGDTGDVGPTGPQGPQGICPQCPPSGGGGFFPFNIVTGSGGDDRSAIQSAIDESASSNKSIYLVGNVKISNTVWVAKTTMKLSIFGYGATLSSTNNNTFTFIKRVQPVNMSEAESMVLAQYHIEGLSFFGTSNQIGLELAPTYDSDYRNLVFEGLKTAIHLRFSLNTTLANCKAVKCLNGFIADMGNWSGSTTSNSQSNQTTFSHCKVVYSVPNASGEVAFGIYSSSGCAMYHCIVEGGKYRKDIDFNFLLSPNVKDFTIDNLHVEGVYGNNGAGSGEAFVYLRLVGIATIKNVYSQFGGCFIDAGGLPGQVSLYIENVSWLVKDNNGKLFHNAGGTVWNFSKNSYQSLLTTPALMPTYFTGTPVTHCTGLPYTCSENKFTIN